MRQVLKKYNKDALIANIRNIKITYSIIRITIKNDGFTIVQNNSWASWYLIPTDVTSKHCPSQGIFNVYSDIGQCNSEEELLIKYLMEKM